jgi:hypothetical protein
MTTNLYKVYFFSHLWNNSLVGQNVFVEVITGVRRSARVKVARIDSSTSSAGAPQSEESVQRQREKEGVFSFHTKFLYKKKKV